MTTVKCSMWKYGVLEDAVTKGSSNISFGKIKIDDGSYPVFGAKGYLKNISFYQQKNDYLAIIKDGAGIGRVSEHPAKSSVLATMQYLLPKQNFEIRFIKYFLESIDFQEYRTGSTIPHIYFKDYKSAPFPLASTSEQNRIVAILDQAFADIEQARAKTEQNLKNARELFESYLQQVAGERKPLGDFVSIKTGKLNSNAAVEGGEYPFFTCSRDVFAIDRFSFDCEAILLAGNNASGDFNVKHYKGKFDAYQRTYVITVDDESKLLYQFLHYQMIKSLKELKESSVGAGTKFLKLGMIKDLKISIPPLDEQTRILGTLLVLKDEIDKLTAIYQEKLNALDNLKKSILQKAFTGELTNDERKGVAA